MIVWLCLLAALAGVLNPVQSGANAQLGKVTANPFAAVMISLSISLAFTLAVGLFGRAPAPAFSQLARAPWWAWAGGFLGAVFLASQPLAAPRLGAAVYIGITVTACLIASIAVDHFGLLGFQQHAAGVGRVLGAALMIAGVALIARF